MLFISQINRQAILLSQQVLKDLTALHSPHTLLLILLILLPQHLYTISQFLLLRSQHFQSRYQLIVVLIHHHSSVRVDAIPPNIEALKHSFFDTVREDIQSHKNSHLILLLILPVNILQFFQIRSIVPNIPMVLFEKSGQLSKSIQHVPPRFFLEHFVEVHILGAPTGPVLADPSCDVEHLSQSLFDIFLKDQVLFPRMECPHHYFFMTPHSKVPKNSIQDLLILLIPRFQIVLNLIWVVTFPHQAVCNLIYLIVTVSCHFISYVFNIDFIPVFFFVYVSKGLLQSIQLHSFYYRWQIVLSLDQMGIPFHQDSLLYTLQFGYFGTQYSKQCSFSLVIQLISFLSPHVPNFIEGVMVNFIEVVAIYCLYLVDKVVDCITVMLQTVKHVPFQLQSVLIVFVFYVGTLCTNKEEIPFPTYHSISNQSFLPPLKHRLDLTSVSHFLQPSFLKSHEDISYQFPVINPGHLFTYKLSSLFNFLFHLIFVLIQVIKSLLDFPLLHFPNIGSPQTHSIQLQLVSLPFKHRSHHILGLGLADPIPEFLHGYLTWFLHPLPAIDPFNG